MEWLAVGAVIIAVILREYFTKVKKSVPPVVIKKGVLTHYHYSGEKTLVVAEGVREIGEYAFGNCGELESVKLPSTLTRINANAFRCCYNLKEVELPEGLVSIGDRAFLSCESLSEIRLPQSLKEIGNAAFQHCISLKNITLPDGITRLEDHTFCACKSLESINFPPYLKHMGMAVFVQCVALQSVKIPEGVKTIRIDCFTGCEMLSEVTFPSTLKSISKDAFYGCVRLMDIDLPYGFESLDSSVFSYCAPIHRMTLPETLTDINENAFRGCNDIDEFNLCGVYVKPTNIVTSWQIISAMKILQQDDMQKELSPDLKVQVALGLYLKTGNRRAESYTRANISLLYPILIDNKRFDEMEKLLDTKVLVNENNIDELIDYAIKTNAHEMYVMLTHYKDDNIGYDNAAGISDRFSL